MFIGPDVLKSSCSVVECDFQSPHMQFFNPYGVDNATPHQECNCTPSQTSVWHSTTAQSQRITLPRVNGTIFKNSNTVHKSCGLNYKRTISIDDGTNLRERRTIPKEDRSISWEDNFRQNFGRVYMERGDCVNHLEMERVRGNKNE